MKQKSLLVLAASLSMLNGCDLVSKERLDMLFGKAAIRNVETVKI